MDIGRIKINSIARRYIDDLKNNVTDINKTIKLSENTLTEYRLTASLGIMLVGYLIEYHKLADNFLFATSMFILIAKILDTLDLFQNQQVSDPSLKYISNNYASHQYNIGYTYMYRFI